MSNIKKNRTGLRLLGNRRVRFTMNKTQQNQPVYSKVQPRCPGKKGYKAGQPCKGSNTKVGCKTCYGCLYSFDVSSNAFNGAYPTYGSFASVNLLVDSSANEPCEWQYNAIVESFSISLTDPSNSTVTLNIEDEKCINASSIEGVYFYAPVGGTLGVYTGKYQVCIGVNAQGQPQYSSQVSQFPFTSGPTQNKFPNNAKRMGAPYRNPIAGWRNSLDCNIRDCSDGTSNWSKQPINTVYKDRYSGKKTSDGTIGCCPKDCSLNKIVHRSGIQGRTHRPIIRRGMQEITGCCTASVTEWAPNVGYQKRRICKPKSDYSFSYRQYMNNKRCLSFERSLEKSPGDYYATTKNRDGKTICQMKYRKSGCAGCCTCCVKKQAFYLSPIGNPSSTISIGDIIETSVPRVGLGTVIEITNPITSFPQIILITVALSDNEDVCNGIRSVLNSLQIIDINGIAVNPATSPGIAGTYVYYSPVFDVENRTGDCGSNKSNTVTIYKPNNKKFSKQGAVSAGSRLDRLKLDTIRSANSRCKKGKKCATVPARPRDPFLKCKLSPNGKYDAGKPRFTGWMFNGHHSEVKSRVYNMVRYNQQPLGIPQLTAHRLTLSQGGNGCGTKKCFPRTLNLGSNRATAAGNRARIPGSKCGICCIVRIYGNAGGPGTPILPAFANLVPGTVLYQPDIGYVGTVIEQVPDPAGPAGGDWGWLTIRFDGREGECKLPIITTTNLDILSTNPSGWMPSDFGIKVAEVSGLLEDYRGCGCTPCANIPDYTAQGLPVC